MTPLLFYLLYLILFGDFVALILVGIVFWFRGSGAFCKGLALIFWATALETSTSSLYFVYPGVSVLPEWFLVIRLFTRAVQSLLVFGFFLHLLGIVGPKPDFK